MFVNHVIPRNQFSEEREIFFPGGIYCQSIHFAQQFSGGRLVAVWWNTQFDASVIAGLPSPKVPSHVANYYFPKS